MGKRVGSRIEEALIKAERDERCLAPSTAADARWLQRASIRGDVTHPTRGLYIRAEYWKGLNRNQQALHVLRALSLRHPDWVFAGPSAAIAHGLEVGYGYLASPCIASTRQAHAEQRKSASHIIVTGDNPVIRQGIRVTSFARTIYDCIRSMTFPDALALADSALRSKGINRERLALNLCHLFGTYPGARRMRAIIGLADGRSENGGESKARAQMIMLGFEIPDLQREIPDPLDPTTCHRIDYAWDLWNGSTVFGELDGRDKYFDPAMTGGKGLEDVLLAERRRESRVTIGDRPIKIVRFSYAEACNDAYFTRLLESYGIPRVPSSYDPSVITF